MNAKVVGIVVLLLVLCAFMAATAPGFLQPNNVENLLRRTAMYGLLGIGVAFVIITGGIDLSVGSVVCLSGCLLAIFLGVQYLPFDYQPIREIVAKDRQIIVNGDAADFEPGDRIRYFGGRRARDAFLVVETIERDGRDSRQSTIIVDQKFSRDDSLGQIAKLLTIVDFDPGSQEQQEYRPASITLEGRHGQLAARDRMTLANASGGLNQVEIAAVTVADDNTVVTLTAPVGGRLSTEWAAIPLQRKQRMSIPLALGSVLAIAIGLGLVHGLLITKMNQQPFVVTLCGLLIYRGWSRWLVSDQPVGFGNEYEHTLSPLGNGKLVLHTWQQDGNIATFGIPYPFFILVAVAILAAIFLNKTIWGRYLLALGRNEQAARYSGIRTGRIVILAYVLSTALAAVGGILFALDANSVSPSSFGNFFELYAIAAAVLGGCSLRGGEGSIFGVIVGTAVMQVLNNLIVLLKISGTLEFAIIGSVILIGVLADEIIKRLATKRRAAVSARQDRPAGEPS